MHDVIDMLHYTQHSVQGLLKFVRTNVVLRKL